MNEIQFYKAMLFWQKNATESLLKYQKKLAELEPNQACLDKPDSLKQYEFAISNVEILEKALPLMRDQWLRDNGPAKPNE